MHGHDCIITENCVIKSSPIQCLLPSTNYASLLVLSPLHGCIKYKWERKNMLTWVGVDVPPSTCILYVNSCGKYRCTIGGDQYCFDVHGKTSYSRPSHVRTLLTDSCSVSYAKYNAGECSNGHARVY